MLFRSIWKPATPPCMDYIKGYFNPKNIFVLEVTLKETDLNWITCSFCPFKYYFIVHFIDLIFHEVIL